MARLALLIGNATFKAQDTFPPLRTPAEDVADMAEVLQKQGNFEIVAQLVDENAASIREQIEAFYSQAKQGDLTLLYYSGHGYKNHDGRLWLVANDTHPERLWTTGVEEDFVRNVKHDSAARHHLIVLDCCFSGAFVETQTKSGDEPLILDKLRGATTAVLTSSSRIQYSFEEIGRNSLFTQYLLEGVRTGQADHDQDGKISVDELFDYVKPKVQARRAEQTPVKSMWAIKDVVYFAWLLPEQLDAMQRFHDAYELLAKGQIVYDKHGEVLTVPQIQHIATHIPDPEFVLTEQQLSLILKSVLLRKLTVQPWLAYENSLTLLRMIWRDADLPAPMREQALIALSKLEDEQTYRDLLQALEDVNGGDSKGPVEETAVFMLHSKKKRPFPQRYWLAVQRILATRRWQSERDNYIWPLARSTMLWIFGLGLFMLFVDFVTDSLNIGDVLFRLVAPLLIGGWIYLLSGFQAIIRTTSQPSQLGALAVFGACTGCLPFALWAQNPFGLAVGAIMGVTLGYVRHQANSNQLNPLRIFGTVALLTLLVCSLILVVEAPSSPDLSWKMLFCYFEPFSGIWMLLTTTDKLGLIQEKLQQTKEWSELIAMTILVVALTQQIIVFTQRFLSSNAPSLAVEA